MDFAAIVQVPQHDAANIVFTEQVLDFAMAITWNGSATFNLYIDGKNWECFTQYDVETRSQAAKVAVEWWQDFMDTDKAMMVHTGQASYS